MGKKLKDPPIVEVICGFFFEPLEELDPLLIGKLWAQRSSDYPKRSLHPPIHDVSGPLISQGVGPLRCWLMSGDEEYVLQIQSDRLYFNWRRRSEQVQYPSFNDRGGNRGVLTRSLDELEQFEAFCKKELTRDLQIRGVELSKQDLLVHGRHQKNLADLAAGLPILAPLCAFAKSPEELLINLTLMDRRGDADVRVQIASATDIVSGASGVQIQTRLSKRVSASPEEELRALNEIANQVFFELVPSDWLDRFGGLES